MLDENFCIDLEFAISEALENPKEEELSGFWCDGVILREDKYSAKFINDQRKVAGRAFIGKTGQNECELIINFGSKSLSRFARGLLINECIPDSERSDWLTVDPVNKRLVLYRK